MTSTSTFKGMDADAKPSSRVLAPPGGGSSNIFGTPAPVKPAPPKETAPAQPAQSQSAQPQNATERSIRSAPKQGEDSFQNLFGSAKDWGSKIDKSRKCSNHSSPSTFNSLFGEDQKEIRQISATSRPGSSFNKLFGDNETNSNVIKKSASPRKNLENLSLNDSAIPQPKAQSHETHNSSFHRVFGEFQGSSTPSRSKQSDCDNAYNPITGQPYDSPKTKPQQSAAASIVVAADVAVEGKENVTSSEVKSKPAPAAEAVKSSTRVAQPPGGKSSGPLW